MPDAYQANAVIDNLFRAANRVLELERVHRVYSFEPGTPFYLQHLFTEIEVVTNALARQGARKTP